MKKDPRPRTAGSTRAVYLANAEHIEVRDHGIVAVISSSRNPANKNHREEPDQFLRFPHQSGRHG